MSWPPELDALRNELKIRDAGDTESLQRALDAAVSFVQWAVIEREPQDWAVWERPPDPELIEGTLRLAGRWYVRGRTPDMLMSAGELGIARVPSFDPDIERLLRIGRHHPPAFA